MTGAEAGVVESRMRAQGCGRTAGSERTGWDKGSLAEMKMAWGIRTHPRLVGPGI